jgi:RNA polymerase sigma-70 factor, ECF subfamily
MEDADLERVIRGAMSGERESFAELVRRYGSFAVQTATGILHDKMEAEDAAQEAFAKAYVSIKKLKSPHAFHAWFSRILTNLCLDRVKRRRSSVSIERVDLAAETAARGREESGRSLNRLMLEEALSSLSPEIRAALVLRELHGFDYQEIATMLSIPIGTVRSRLHAGRMQLRNYLSQDTQSEKE